MEHLEALQSIVLVCLQLLSNLGILTRHKRQVINTIKAEIKAEFEPVFSELRHQMALHDEETKNQTEKLDLLLSLIRTDKFTVTRNHEKNHYRKGRRANP